MTEFDCGKCLIDYWYCCRRCLWRCQARSLTSAPCAYSWCARLALWAASSWLPLIAKPAKSPPVLLQWKTAWNSSIKKLRKDFVASDSSPSHNRFASKEKHSTKHSLAWFVNGALRFCTIAALLRAWNQVCNMLFANWSETNSRVDFAF